MSQPDLSVYTPREHVERAIADMLIRLHSRSESAVRTFRIKGTKRRMCVSTPEEYVISAERIDPTLPKLLSTLERYLAYSDDFGFSDRAELIVDINIDNSERSVRYQFIDDRDLTRYWSRSTDVHTDLSEAVCAYHLIRNENSIVAGKEALYTFRKKMES